MFADLPDLGWYYLRKDTFLLSGEYLFRNPLLAVVILMAWVLLWLWLARGGSSLIAEVESAAKRAATHARLIVPALALASVLICSAISLGPLGGLPHIQDETAYLFTARTFAAGRLTVPPPPAGLGPAFETVFVVREPDRWYGKYPPGWPAVLALGVLARLPWLVNPLLTGVAVLLFHGLMRRCLSPAKALLTTALLVTSPFVLVMGATQMSHPLVLVLLLLALHAAVRVADQRCPSEALSWWWLAGACFAWMAATRPLEMLCLAPPPLVAMVAGARARSRRLAPRLVVLAIPVLVVLVLHLAYNDVLTGSPWVHPFLRHNPADRPGFGVGVGTFSPEGHNVFKAVMNLTMNTLALNEDLFGWPFLSLFLAGLGAWLPERWSWITRVMVAQAILIACGYFTFMGHGVAYGARYYHSLVPVLILLTVTGIEEVGRRLGPAARAATLLTMSLAFVIALATWWPVRLADLHDYWGVFSRPLDLVPPPAGSPATSSTTATSPTTASSPATTSSPTSAAPATPATPASPASSSPPSSTLGSRARIVVIPTGRVGARDFFDAFAALNPVPLPTHPTDATIFVRDGPWVQDGRVARAYPGVPIVRIAQTPLREALTRRR